MQRSYKLAAALSIPVTVLIVVLRIVLLPMLQESETGLFQLSYAVLGLFAAFMIAALILCMSARKERGADIISLRSALRRPVAFTSIISGFALAAFSLFDAVNWQIFGIAPPPNSVIINGLDTSILILTLIFGITGGCFLIWLGFSLIVKRVTRGSPLSLAALLPVLWIWFRLVRCEISHATEIRVSQSFYDFIMLIFIMLFLFMFARHISGISSKASSSWKLIFFSLCASVMAISGPVTRVIMFFMQEEAAFNSSQLAGFPELCIGVFASIVAWALAFGTPAPESDLVPDGGQDDESADSPASSDIDSVPEEAFFDFPEDKKGELQK